MDPNSSPQRFFYLVKKINLRSFIFYISIHCSQNDQTMEIEKRLMVARVQKWAEFKGIYVSHSQVPVYIKVLQNKTKK